jgi:hypothetical protein
MYNVDKELKKLKAKIDDASLKDQDNAKMKRLEEQRTMFKSEATRLHKICTDNDQKIKELKFQNKKLVDDKNYYEGFVIGKGSRSDFSRDEKGEQGSEKRDDVAVSQEEHEQVRRRGLNEPELLPTREE